MPGTADSPESRRFKRVQLVGNSSITLQNEKEPLHAMIDNINRGGIGLLTKNPLPLGIPVSVGLEFLDKQGNSVSEEIRGRIIRSTPWNKIHIIGIEFFSIINPTEHPRLFSFLQEAEKK